MSKFRFKARHLRGAGGKAAARIDVEFYYDWDETARALAAIHPELPSKIGSSTVQRALREHALHPNRKRRDVPDTELDWWKDKLVEIGVFGEDGTLPESVKSEPGGAGRAA